MYTLNLVKYKLVLDQTRTVNVKAKEKNSFTLDNYFLNKAFQCNLAHYVWHFSFLGYFEKIF